MHELRQQLTAQHRLINFGGNSFNHEHGTEKEVVVGNHELPPPRRLSLFDKKPVRELPGKNELKTISTPLPVCK